MTTPEPGNTDRTTVTALEALAEKAYDEMYDSRTPAVCYSDFKDYFIEAIAAAEGAGLSEDAQRLTNRLAHCKQVYRSQFSSF